MTRIIKRLVIVAAVAVAALGVSITAAAAANASHSATGFVTTDNEHDWG